ncbi:hypothetical protein D3C86_1818930 [compost metagenome]
MVFDMWIWSSLQNGAIADASQFRIGVEFFSPGICCYHSHVEVIVVLLETIDERLEVRRQVLLRRFHRAGVVDHPQDVDLLRNIDRFLLVRRRVGCKRERTSAFIAACSQSRS